MWAVAAQPRVGLTPMIPTPSFDGVEVTRTSLSCDWGGARSGDSGLAGRDGLDSQFDTGRLADEEAAGFESHVPGEPEVLAVDLGGCAEANALVAHGGGAATVEVDLQGDGPGRAVHGQIAHELPGVVAQWPHRGRCEGDRWVVLHVEEVRALEVGITVVVSRAQAGHADLHFDVRVLRLLGDRDPATH